MDPDSSPYILTGNSPNNSFSLSQLSTREIEAGCIKCWNLSSVWAGGRGSGKCKVSLPRK